MFMWAPASPLLVRVGSVAALVLQDRELYLEFGGTHRPGKTKIAHIVSRARVHLNWAGQTRRAYLNLVNSVASSVIGPHLSSPKFVDQRPISTAMVAERIISRFQEYSCTAWIAIWANTA